METNSKNVEAYAGFIIRFFAFIIYSIIISAIVLAFLFLLFHFYIIHFPFYTIYCPDPWCLTIIHP